MSSTQGKELCQKEFQNKSFPSLLQLSEDLRTLFSQGLASDIVLFTDGKDIKCHKAILSTRSNWFSIKIRQLCVPGMNVIRINENSKILSAVLLYIYSGNLELLEALDIPLVDVRNAADKYGLSNLKRIATDIIKYEYAADETKCVEFCWNVRVDSQLPLISDCPALKDFSLHGSDKWGLEMQQLFHGDGTCIIGLYLRRKTSDKSCKVVHFVSARVYILNVNGSKKLSFKAELVISEDMKIKVAEFAPEIGQKVNCGVLYPDSTLNLTCELKISGKLRSVERFQLKGEFKKCVSTELLHLSRDMLQMLKIGKYSDASIQLKGCPLLQVHSYIIRGRLGIPISFLSKLADVTGFGKIVWKSFIFFLYTGQTLYLDDHMRAIYRGLNELHLKESALKYSVNLANNLDVNNALDILKDALKFGDKDLISCAACFLARNSNNFRDPETWINIANDNLIGILFRL